MKNHIDIIYKNTNLKEGKSIIENILIEIYFNGPMSNKDLARYSMLPIPVVSAIKKEFINCGLVEQKSGSSITEKGIEYVENCLGYKGINKEFYLELLENPWKKHREIIEIEEELIRIFENRPVVDVKLDQSKATVETSLKRAILGVINHSIIGKNILCLGDDDLVSVAIALLIKKLFNNDSTKTTIKVVDIDERIIAYINEISRQKNFNIETINIDLRQEINGKYRDSFNTLFTDPPYTKTGLDLFLLRGLELMKKDRGSYIFLSFGNKSPLERFEMQEIFIDKGLLIVDIIPNFNKYEGANIIANQGQMIILNIAKKTNSEFSGIYNKLIYTGDINKTTREYICLNCGNKIKIGKSEEIKTIENLKSLGCSNCKNKTFKLNKKYSLKGDLHD